MSWVSRSSSRDSRLTLGSLISRSPTTASSPASTPAVRLRTTDVQRYLVTILAAVTALLDGGHIAALFRPEWVVLIAAVVTAVVALVQALAEHDEADERKLFEQIRQQQKPPPQKGE